MKSTLTDKKQLFNVKAIAAANLSPSDIPEGQFGIVDVATDKTVAPTDFASLPDEFKLISKLGGKVYYSFDNIKKDELVTGSAIATPYSPEKNNIWETTIADANFEKSLDLVLNYDQLTQNTKNGIGWEREIFTVTPVELDWNCDGTYPIYENNIITSLLAKKINAVESPFFEAEVRSAADDSVIADPEALAATNKAVNTDADGTNNGPLFKLVVKSKLQPAGLYHDLEVNYVYPRGVRLNPVIQVDGVNKYDFTELQANAYEIGAGYDLRAEEFECMSLYTNLNFYPQLSDKLASPDLVYQFENGVNYNTVIFEFKSKKSGEQDTFDGNYKRFSVLLGTSDGTVFSTLSSIFLP